jgi:hypothetical protein
MNQYVKESISKGERFDETARDVLIKARERRLNHGNTELRHGDWIHEARKKLHSNMFSNPSFALLLVFFALFCGSIFLFENMQVVSGPLYAMKVVVTSLFAVTLGFITSVWWSKSARFDERVREAQRIDAEYRELLMSFSDSLFDIINALNTLSKKPPPPFIVATDFLLGEYVHLLQSRLQRYGDYIAGLGFDASDFLDEKMRIFEGIRERASLSIEGMPTELESVFVDSLSLDMRELTDAAAQRQHELRSKLEELDGTDRTDGTGEMPRAAVGEN